ncbi:GTP-binding protein rho1 [Zancudomyces culisetae]|uniref:GTP-binding protein rho1 n=1 Tax=Zancudomyces culisetae TaxID=1213189 RepID=A0A1R1PYF0_ZANCU|nr:GTP-binding protein rho1 [Zancudomyces culisetae]|eukprot:OMH85978.1 GTP-binding protein rho1 [Zancudomyces culisetae]
MNDNNLAITRRKVVIVGDGACGKTCLLLVFREGEFPIAYKYVPTVFENWVADMKVDGRPLELELWDTAGQEDYDRLRYLSYPESNAVLICFSVDSPDSLENVEEKWINEVIHYAPGVAIVLVALKTDLRNDESTISELAQHNQRPLTTEEGKAVAKRIGASLYLECSAKEKIGVAEVFYHTARICLSKVDKPSQKSSGCCTIL